MSDERRNGRKQKEGPQDISIININMLDMIFLGKKQRMKYGMKKSSRLLRQKIYRYNS